MSTSTPPDPYQPFNYQVPKKPWYRQKWGIALIVVAVIAVIMVLGTLADSGESNADAKDDKPAAAKSEKPAEDKSEKPKPEKTEKPEPKVVHDIETYSCDDLIVDVKALSEDRADETGALKIIEIYKAKAVKDVQDRYRLGKVKVPAGEVRMPVLVCNGLAAASDGGSYPIKYSYEVDLDDQPFITFEDR